MKVPLLALNPNQIAGKKIKRWSGLVLALLLFSIKPASLWAEGSKDFVNYPGYRMFLDTRDNQQLKVFARVGETINVGASHTGLNGGFIRVYRPDGTVAITFDNTGTGTGLAIINNNVQEINGPTGGGTAMGSGYIPGTITVGSGEEGIWTVLFDYPSYENTGFFNLLNNAPWTRSVDQPPVRRVVLAWDVTVTSGGAGNQIGSTVHEGRLFTNEHISLINGNGFSTSPSFFVLTEDGYLYRVDMNMADPFRFPISSNSLGLVSADFNPIYKSKPESSFTRSDNPASWGPTGIFLYEPQAQDFDVLINNKIFFNIPDPTLPAFAKVTDIFRNNSHQTWLFKPIETLTLDTLYFIGSNPGGISCAQNTMAFGKGAWFVFETNLGGSVTLELDLNNNGSYSDLEDVRLEGQLLGGRDSIFWNGKNGLGVSIPIQDSFEFRYRGIIKFGEIHIALTDVENSGGGVTFKWLNAPAGLPDSLFYYDHSDIGGAVSGGGTPGNAMPTSTPFPYSFNFGNDKYLDHWSFIEFDIPETPITIRVITQCDCDGVGPQLVTVSGGGDFCEGESRSLRVTNSNAGVNNITYTWSGPNGFSQVQTLGKFDTSTVVLSPLTSAQAGVYQVIAETVNDCADTLTFQVNVNPRPVISAITGGGTFCSGNNVTLTASNTVAGVVSSNYTWTGPNNFMETGNVIGTGQIVLNLSSVTESNEGTYTLTLVSNNGCLSAPASTNVIVNPTPVLVPVSSGGAVCEGDNITLSAVNTAAGVGTMTCTWVGPNGAFSSQTVNGGDTIKLNLTNVSFSQSGTYTLTCSSLGCTSAPISFNVTVNRTPEINGTSPNGNFCIGTDTVLTAMNVVAGTGPLNYTWTGPNGYSFSGIGPSTGPFNAPLNNLQLNMAGTYTLVLTTANGCASVPQSVTIGVLASPVISGLPSQVDACIGQDVQISATNSTPGTCTILYTWSGPNGTAGGGVTGNNGPFILNLNDIQVSHAGTYTLSLICDDTGCASQPASVNVSVTSGLNITNVTPDSSYCAGSSITLSATNTVNAGNITYTWTGPNGFSFTNTVGSFTPLSVTLNNLNPAMAGVYTLNATSAAGCVAPPVSVTVGVLPVVGTTGVSGGGVYCEGATVNLSAIGTGGASSVTYTWTGPCGFSFTDTVSGAGPFSATVSDIPAACSGNYVLNVTTVDGCAEGPFTVNVSVMPRPIIVNLSPDSTVCANDTLTLCGENSVAGIANLNYTWTAPNGQSFTGTGEGSDPFCATFLPVSNFGAGAYTLVLSNGGCTSETDTVNISLNPNPVISAISGGGNYCAGQTATLKFYNTTPGIDSVFYTCIFNGVSTTGKAGGTDTIEVNVTQSGTLSCSLESFDGCVSSLATTNIVFQPVPTPVVNPSVSICDDIALTLTGQNSTPGTGTVTYTWTGPGGFSFTGTAPWAGPFPAQDNDPETGQYCLTLSSAAGCTSNAACTSVTVNPKPVVQGGISGGGPICEGQAATLTATAFISDNSIMTYSWLTASGTVIQTGTVASGGNLSLNVTTGGQYCLRLTSNNNCVSDLVCTTVTVNPKPAVQGGINGGGEICEGQTANLTATATISDNSSMTYTWTKDGVTVQTGTVANNGTLSLSATMTGTYCVRLSSNAGCQSDEVCTTVTVNPRPVISASSGGGSFCEGETTTVSFTVNPNGAASVTYTLTGPGVNMTNTVSQTTVVNVDVTVGGTTTGTYTMTVVSADGCEGNPASVTVSQKQIQPPTITASATTLCPGDELQLTTNAQTGTNVSYEWFKNGQLLTTTTVPVLNVNDPMTANYSVRALVDGCTNTSGNIAVTVLPVPVANDDSFQGPTNTVLNDNVLSNDNTGGNNVTITILTQPANGTVTVNSSGEMTYTPNNTFAGDDEFTYQICLANCPDVCDQAKVSIKIIQEECIVPNIITPNGDGVNDVLFIGCVPTNPNNSLHIFNRWGDEIFVADPYNNDWEGTYGKDKKALPAGTYFYLFKRDRNESDVMGGYIKVVR